MNGNNMSVQTTRTVVIVQPLVPAGLNPLSKIPFNTSPSIWSGTATGGNGSYTYRWQKSADNMTWTDVGIAASTPWGTNYTPGNLTTSAYFRMRVSSGTQTAVSNSHLVEVMPSIESGDIAFTQVIAPNTTPAIIKGTTAKGGTGVFTYQWQQSADGTTWQDISGAQAVDYQPTSLTATTWYRRQATQAGVTQPASTQVAVVYVQQPGQAPAAALAAPPTAAVRQPRALLNLPGITAQHFNRTIQFEARRPAVVLQSNLLNQPHTDGDIAVSYADGLQRPVQQVAARANTQLTDMVTANQYDAFGRTTDDFLSFSDNTANPSLFRNNPQSLLSQFYNGLHPGENFLYSTALSSDEAEGDILGQSAPGNAMAGRAVGGRTVFRTYMAQEAVWQFIIHNNQPALPALAAHRVYGNRDLTSEETVDANNRRLIKYYDMEGLLVMEKLQQTESPGVSWHGWNCTYYVYDDMGNLRFVLPQVAVSAWRPNVPASDVGSPVLVTTQLLNDFGYIFTYDAFGRILSKKVPGVAPESYVYDRLGRQIMSQDAKQALANQWSHIEFDHMGRPSRTAIITTTTPVASLRSAAALSTNFLPAGALDLQTETFYDGYSFPGASAKAFSSTIMTQLVGGSNEVLSNAASSLNRGRLTGVRTRVLYPAGVPQGPAWLLTVNYYDRNGRLIQSQADNILGGNDITAMRYNFEGTLLSQALRHENPRIPAGHPTHLRTLDVRKRYEYYANGSLHRAWQQIGTQPEQQLLEHAYNALGQLTRKTLGANIETLNYTYNIQGQLTGINESYVRNRLAAGHHWWGTTLHYYDGFTQARTDGTLTGMAWRSRGHHRHAYAYGMVYDILGRISQAHFTTNTATIPGSSGWVQTHNYTVDNIAYDDAGNLLSMRSSSTAYGDTRVIDNLQYQYSNQGHRLTAVNDQAGPQPVQLAHFRDSVQQANEYAYDANGNLTQDNNKGFTATWNLLEKPETISFAGNRQLRYVYDATGQRLQKWATVAGVHTSTSYIGGLLYQNDTLLLEFAHDAGRMRRNRLGRLVPDFYITDHLGNTRMVLTAERDTFSYHNTYESPRTNLEQAIWVNRQPVRDSITSTTPFFSTAGHACLHPQGQPCPNHWASRLNGNIAGRRVGTGIVLRVMSGDTLAYSTRAIYTQPHSSAWNTAQAIATMASAVAGAFVGPAATPFDGKAHLLTNGSTIINTTAFQSAIGHQQANTSPNNTPRAFLKALFFDEQLALADSAFIRIDRGANTVHTYHDQRTASANGYVYIYVTNESGQDVWFDDLMVTHRTGPLLQEAHFYPFGQEITPLSSKALLKTPNDRMLQQNEWDEEHGLNLHDFDARMYDASIGRFWGVDVLADKQFGLTPYHYGANNPVMMRDPDGRLFFLPALLIAGKALAKAKFAKGAIAAFKATKVGKAVTSAASAVKAATAKVSGKLSAGKFGKFMKGNFRPIAAGARNVYNNRHQLAGGDWLQGLALFGAGFGGGKLAMIGYNSDLLGETVSFGSEFFFETAGAMAGGLGTMMTNIVAGDLEDNPLQSFARGAGAVISSKFDEKAFLKGKSGVKRFYGKHFANGTIFSSVGAVANGYGEYGQKYAEAYGGGIWWQMALGGLLGGAATGGMDGWGERLSNRSLFTRFANVALTTFTKDVVKGSTYHFFNKDYRKKNSWGGTVFSTNGSGLNMGFGIASFFFGVLGR